MDDVFEKLRELQDILTEKISIEKDIQEIPKIISTQEEVLERTKKNFFDLNQNYDKAKTAVAEYQKAVTEAGDQRESSEKKMDLISTQREYEALDLEIKSAAKKEQEFRAELLREQRILSELDTQIKDRASLIEQQEADLAERRKGIEKDIAKKNAQKENLEKQEKNLSKDIDPEVYYKFERIIRNKMDKGIVAIKGGVCMGCHMILPKQFAYNVKQGEEIVFCPYCSRILYYEEDEQDGEDFFDNSDSGSLSDLDDLEEDDYDDDESEAEEDKDSMDFDG